MGIQHVAAQEYPGFASARHNLNDLIGLIVDRYLDHVRGHGLDDAGDPANPNQPDLSKAERLDQCIGQQRPIGRRVELSRQILLLDPADRVCQRDVNEGSGR